MKITVLSHQGEEPAVQVNRSFVSLEAIKRFCEMCMSGQVEIKDDNYELSIPCALVLMEKENGEPIMELRRENETTPIRNMKELFFLSNSLSDLFGEMEFTIDFPPFYKVCESISYLKIYKRKE